MNTITEIETSSVSDISGNNVTATGSILKLGTSTTLSHGFCWNTSGSPTVNDNRLNLGIANNTGLFSSNISNLSPSETYFIRAFATNDAGTNYGEELSFTTPKLEQSITFNSLNEVSYGDVSFELTGTTNSGLPIIYNSSNAEIATIIGNLVTILKPGTITITASQPGNDIYNAALNVQQKLVVNKAILTVTADNKTKKYGDNNPVFTFSYSGFKNSDDATLLASEPTISCEADASTDAGTVSITLEGGEDDNYSFDFVNSTLRIDKTVLFITADHKTKVYGEANPEFTLSYSGFVNGDSESNLDVTPYAACPANESSLPGEYIIHVFPETGDNNYFFVRTTGTLTVITATSIEEKQQMNLATYPNPITNELHVKWDKDNTITGEIQIFTVNGHLVKRISNYNSDEKILVGELVPGSYILKINIGDENYSKVFIKNK
jgi:hypothetical protein